MKWIKETEAVFKTCKCADGDKVIYAISLLKGEALYWWDMVTDVRGSEAVDVMTWEEFKRILRERFCPRSAIKELEEEFMQLEQGNMTVGEYTTRFNERARFSEHHIATEERRVERFMWGLRADIREFISPMNLVTFQSVMEAAEVREKEKNRQDKEIASLKRKWEGGNNEGMLSRTDKNEGHESGPTPCSKCNKMHKGECRAGQRVCYKCGKTDHIASVCKEGRLCFICKSPNHVQANCPQVENGVNHDKGGNQDGRSKERRAGVVRPTGRAFQMVAEEVEEANDA